jgi:hypothetical protein
VQPEEVLELVRSGALRYRARRVALPCRRLKRKEIGERVVRTEAGRRAFQIFSREVPEVPEAPRPSCAPPTIRGPTFLRVTTSLG